MAHAQFYLTCAVPDRKLRRRTLAARGYLFIYIFIYLFVYLFIYCIFFLSSMGEGERRRRDSEAQGSPKWSRFENVQKNGSISFFISSFFSKCAFGGACVLGLLKVCYKPVDKPVVIRFQIELEFGNVVF